MAVESVSAQPLQTDMQSTMQQENQRQTQFLGTLHKCSAPPPTFGNDFGNDLPGIPRIPILFMRSTGQQKSLESPHDAEDWLHVDSGLTRGSC